MKNPRGKVVGFIVSTPFNGPLVSGDNAADKSGVLWADDTVSLFPTKAAAEKAIRKTVRHAEKIGFAGESAWINHYIREVVRVK